VMVGDADRCERGGERIAGEVRVATRRRISPHVHHLSDPMDREQVQKLSELPSRVPDRVDHSEKQNVTVGLVATRGTSELDDASSKEDCMTEKEQFLTQLEKELPTTMRVRSEEHTSELQSRGHLVCRLLLEKKKKKKQ